MENGQYEDEYVQLVNSIRRHKWGLTLQICFTSSKHKPIQIFVS